MAIKKLTFFLLLFTVLGMVIGFMQFRTATAIAITTTKIFTVLAYDGYAQHENVSYTIAREATTSTYLSSSFVYDRIGQWQYSNTYRIYRSFLYFDTSTLPNTANLTAANLSLYIAGDYSSIDFNITIQTGSPTYPHTPIQTEDYYYGFYVGNGGSRNTSTIMGVGNYWNITLNTNGLSWIDLQSITKLCLRSNNDITNSTPGLGIANREWLEISSYEGGSAWVPKLYVTYEYEGYKYILHGPYYDDGSTPADTNVSVTLYSKYQPPETFLMPNGSSTYTVETENIPNHFIWNISSPTLNESRFYWLTSTFEEIYLFIPLTDAPHYTYSVTLNDFAGIDNAYVESMVYYEGANRVVERQPFTPGNPMPFWLCWGYHYTFHLVCDRGEKTWDNIIPASSTDIQLSVSVEDFTPTVESVNVALAINRQNATWIRITYMDYNYETINATVTITHMSNTTTVTDNQTSYVANSFTFNWYGADSSTDYYANVTAYKASEWYIWIRSLPKLPSGDEPWAGFFDMFGVWPVPSQYIVGILLMLTVLVLFSQINIDAGIILECVIAGVLNYMRWINVSWALISVAIALGIMFALAEAQKRERFGL